MLPGVLRGAFNLSPIVPRDASFSDCTFYFFDSGAGCSKFKYIAISRLTYRFMIVVTIFLVLWRNRTKFHFFLISNRIEKLSIWYLVKFGKKVEMFWTFAKLRFPPSAISTTNPGASLHHWDATRAPWNPPVDHSSMWCRGFEGALRLVLIMPRDLSISVGLWLNFQS